MTCVDRDPSRPRISASSRARLTVPSIAPEIPRNLRDARFIQVAVGQRLKRYSLTDLDSALRGVRAASTGPGLTST